MADTLTRNAAVESDMRRIFGTMDRRRAPPIASEPSPEPSLPVVVAASKGRIVRIVAPLIVLVAFVAILAMVLVPTAIVPEQPGDTMVAEDAAPPAPAASAMPVATVALPPEAERTAEASAALPVDSAPETVEVEVAETSSAERRPAAKDEDERPAPRAEREEETEETSIAAAPRTAQDRALCWRDPDKCLYRDVVAADQRLVRAYQRARQAGVSVAQMRGVRREWDRALDDALEEPGEMIDTYDRLASELDEARAQAERR